MYAFIFNKMLFKNPPTQWNLFSNKIVSPGRRWHTFCCHYNDSIPYAMLMTGNFKIKYHFQKLCNLENIGNDHDVQHSQWPHSMANFNIYKSRTWVFFTSCHRLPDIKYYTISGNCDLEDIGRGHEQHSQWRHSMTIPDFLSVVNSNVCSISRHLRDIR